VKKEFKKFEEFQKFKEWIGLRARDPKLQTSPPRSDSERLRQASREVRSGRRAVNRAEIICCRKEIE
jgi:hypothetical protein